MNTICVHYLDGTVQGPRIAESRASPLRIFAGPWPNVRALAAAGLPPTPTAYLLTGPAANGTLSLAVRPGEGGDARRRLQEHAADPTKAGFAEIYAITAVDARLTKADVRYLEARLHELVAAAPGSALEVDRVPPVFEVPRAERDTLESWLTQARTLLHAAGCRAIDAYGLPVIAKAEAQEDDDGRIAIGVDAVPGEAEEFELTYDGIWARGVPHPSGFVVRAGSDVRRRENLAILPTIIGRRQWLQDRGVLGEIPGVVDRWRLMASVLLPSSLIAAKTITGAHVSTKGIWRPVSPAARLVVAR